MKRVCAMFVWQYFAVNIWYLMELGLYFYCLRFDFVLLFVFIRDGIVTIVEATSMWLIYLVYVLIVVLGEAYKKWAKKQRRKKRRMKQLEREKEEKASMMDRVMPAMKVFSKLSERL